jgi:cytochrome c-type biogenesis protein
MIAAVAGGTNLTALYAFSLGLVAAVNPCGFPILPAYLTLTSSGRGVEPLAVRVIRAIGAGIAVTCGFVMVFGLLGGAAEAGLSLALGWLPWVMVPLGLACVAYGGLTVAGRTVPLHVPTRRLLAGRRRSVALVGFGVTYALASLGCALPLFVGVIVGDFARRGLTTGLVGGLSYALGMGLVITAISLAGVGAQQLRLHRLRAAQPVLQRVAGGIVALIGAYLVLYWVSDAVAPLSTPAPVALVNHIQSTVEGWLAGSPRLAGALIAVVVLGCFAAASVHLIRGDRGENGSGRDDLVHTDAEAVADH